LSVGVPALNVVLGAYNIPQSDVIECRVYLGCTKEVSSFSLLLQNWNAKYSPGGTVPLSVGLEGIIKIGRVGQASYPQVISCRVESLKYFGKPMEAYVQVSGRCLGERLFRRVFTGAFFNQKGEAIVKHLLDNYVGLSHVRDSTELVEDTDTTYTKLEYENTPVFDIIKEIAESADKQGVIGFDFRVAPDGKFEFFPRNSKTSSVSLSELIEEYEYRRDIHGVRNKITVYGVTGATLPRNKDRWTEGTTSMWQAVSSNTTISLVSGAGYGSYCIRVYRPASEPVQITAQCTIKDESNNDEVIRVQGKEKLKFMLKNESGLQRAVYVYLLAPDSSNYFYSRTPFMGADSWVSREADLGPNNTYDAQTNPNGLWEPHGNADWHNIRKIWFQFADVPTREAMIYIDALHFTEQRYKAVAQDTGSQNSYGLRELVEVDEELYSDNECSLRANALLDYYKSPAEYLTVRSTVIDYGSTPLLPGDRIQVNLPNENVSGYFRILSVEYRVDAKTQTLEITLELGRETPLLADYLYALKSKTDHLSRYKASR